MRQGYKQTEVGVIPEDWDAGGLGYFWSVTDCKHVTAQFVSNGFPIASIKEVQGRFVDVTNAKQTTQQFYTLLIDGGRKPKVGDLILSRNATVGEVAQVAEWHPPFAMGQDVCLLRKKAPELSTNYLQQVFRSPIVTNQLMDLMVGSTFKRVNIEQIRNFTVPMPPSAEQETIAEALSDADALIESLEQLIAKKRQIKQGAMQDLLTGKKRLPGFSKKWEVWRLAEVADVIKGRGLSKNQLSESGCRYCVLYGELFTSYGRVISRVVSKTDSTDGTISVAGDVLVPGSTTTTGIDLATASALMVDGVAIGGDINIIRRRSDNVTNSVFLANYLTNVKRQEIADRAQGITIIHLYGRDLLDLPLDFPPFAEQTAIATILSDMDTELATLETKLTKARQLKQGMMQELLTGRIRLI